MAAHRRKTQRAAEEGKKGTKKKIAFYTTEASILLKTIAKSFENAKNGPVFKRNLAQNALQNRGFCQFEVPFRACGPIHGRLHGVSKPFWQAP